MNLQKLDPIQYSAHMQDISKLIKNVAQYNTGLSDLLTRSVNKLHWHIVALESEIEVMEGLNNVGQSE